MLDPRAGIRKAGAMGPLMALLKEVTEVGPLLSCLSPSHLAPCHVVLSLYGTECRVSGCLCRRTVGHLVGLHQKVRVALF